MEKKEGGARLASLAIEVAAELGFDAAGRRDRRRVGREHDSRGRHADDRRARPDRRRRSRAGRMARSHAASCRGWRCSPGIISAAVSDAMRPAPDGPEPASTSTARWSRASPRSCTSTVPTSAPRTSTRARRPMQLLGYTSEEWGTTPRSLGREDPSRRRRARCTAENDRSNETGEPFFAEYRMFAKDGRIVWIRDEAVLVARRRQSRRTGAA